MNEDYPLKEIGTGAKVFSGFAFKSKDLNDEEGIPVVKIGNIHDRKVTLGGSQFFPEELVNEKQDKFFLEDRDVLIAMTGQGSVGRVGQIRLNGEKALLNQRVGKFIVDGENLDRDYLYFVISSPRYERILFDTGSGSGQPNLSPNQILSVEIPFPRIEIQMKISEILRSLNDKIYLNEKINLQLERIGQLIFKRWFIDFEFPDESGEPYKSSGGEMVFNEELGKEIPEGWEVKSISEIANFLNGLALQKYPPENEKEYLPVIKIKELRQGITEASDKASLNIPKEYIVKDGDILFSWSGSLEVAIWTFGKGALNQHLFKVTSKEYPKWLYYYWILQHLPEYRHIAEGKATTMGHIQRYHLRSSLVLVPDSTTLQIMDKTFSPIIEKRIKVSIESRTLSQIRDLLLPRLISGKIRVPVEVRT